MSLEISRILHAGYLFKSKKAQIIFDPIFENPFSTNCYAFPNVEFDTSQIKNLTLDAVFISHYHDDHCSFESLNLLNRNTPIYIYCIFDEMLSLIKELGFENVFALEINKTVRINDFEVTPRRALDSDVDSIFQIQVAHLNILNVVDSWIDDETLNFLARTQWDLILWPFQSMQEVEVLAPRIESSPPSIPEEHLNQLKILNPKFLVPSSCQFKFENWSWYNHAFFSISYKHFEEKMFALIPTTKVIRLNPSASVTLSKDAIQKNQALTWVQPLGNQDGDYEYRQDLIPPPTAEIAKKLFPLSEDQITRTQSFCKQELIKRYQALDLSEEEFFRQPLHWKLILYTDQGKATEFCYYISGAQIELIQDATDVTWKTEVPMAKLFAALENGEALTSMYIRIHPMDNSVDIVEDPLIRCLYNGRFASYQKAQLRRIFKNA